MTRPIVTNVLAFLVISALAAGLARAANEGQADLDKAIQLKLNVATLSDLTEVIRLCESGLKKGLDPANTKFAKDLLGSAYVQRGSSVIDAVRGDQSLDPKKFAEYRQVALGDLEKGLEINPKQPQALFMIARLNLLPGGDAKRAADALDETIKQSADDASLKAQALLLRAELAKDSKKKLADADEAARLAPSNAAILRARGEIRADLDQSDGALADFNKALELEPKHFATVVAKALLLAKMKKYDEAIATLEQAHQLDPDSILPTVQKARVYGAQGKWKSALEELNKADEAVPENVAVLLIRSGVYQELGEKEKAMADVNRVLDLKPDMPEAVRTRAMLLADAKKYDEAVADLERLRKADPKDDLTVLQLGMLLNGQKKYQKAIEIFNGLLVEHPDQWMAMRGRADALLNFGKRAEAIADYEKAAKLQPKDVGVLNNLAWVLATAPEDKLRDGKRAFELADEACRQTEYKQDYLLSTLAAACAEKGDFAAAIKWAGKAVELGTKEHIDSLKKELESYKAGKPWRESLPAAEKAPEEKKDSPQPEPKK